MKDYLPALGTSSNQAIAKTRAQQVDRSWDCLAFGSCHRSRAQWFRKTPRGQNQSGEAHVKTSPATSGLHGTHAEFPRYPLARGMEQCTEFPIQPTRAFLQLSLTCPTPGSSAGDLPREGRFAQSDWPPRGCLGRYSPPLLLGWPALYAAI